jgi:hypothetical protein
LNPQNEDENQYASSLPQKQKWNNRTEKTEKKLRFKKLGAKIKYGLFFVTWRQFARSMEY